jgi:hypothetical protein
MENQSCLLNLRKFILSVCSVSEKSLSDLLETFSPGIVKKDDFFSSAGDYSTRLAFICQGLVRSFYVDLKGHELIKGFFSDNMFIMPLPAYIYRKPTFINYQSLVDTEILYAKYIDLEMLTRKHRSIDKFTRRLVDREWIINKEIHESGLYIYNAQTRYRIFASKFPKYLSSINPEFISSFLQIPLKQVIRFLQEGKD